MNIARECYIASQAAGKLRLLEQPTGVRLREAREDHEEDTIIFLFEDGSELHFEPFMGGFWAWDERNVAEVDE